MENNQIQKHTLPTNQLSVIGEIQLADTGKLIRDASEEEIKQVLRYAFVLMGTPADKMPKDQAKDVLHLFIKKRLWMVKIEEMRLAFEYAVEKRTEVNLTLYGESFSAKMVLDVVDAFTKYKKGLLNKLPNDEGMNNTQRLGVIASMLNPETVKLIKEIGKPKEKPKPELYKHPYYDLHQRWFKQFDFLLTKFREEFDHEGKQISGKFIKRYGQIMNIEAFFNKKAEQLSLKKIADEYRIEYFIEKVYRKLPNLDKLNMSGQIAIPIDKGSYYLLTQKKTKI